MNWPIIDNLSFYIMNFATILVQSLTLKKLTRSGNYKAFIKITSIFLLANVIDIVGALTYYEYLKHKSNNALLAFYSLSLAINNGLGNNAHWGFSFEYYNMVRIIPFVLDETLPPQSIVNSNKAQFWLWTILNTVAAVLLGVSFYFGNITGHLKIAFISLYILTLLSFI